jgi:hypothetical protein
LRLQLADQLVSMDDASESDEAGDNLADIKPESAAAREARLEREAKLRKLVEDDGM